MSRQDSNGADANTVRETGNYVQSRGGEYGPTVAFDNVPVVLDSHHEGVPGVSGSTARKAVCTSLAAGAVGVGLLGLAAAPAVAGTSTAAITVSSSTVKAGGTFIISVVCAKPPAGNSATLSTSSIGGSSSVKMYAQPTGFVYTVNVPSSIKPGAYNFPITCGDGSNGREVITVVPSGTIHTGGGYTSSGVDSTAVAVGAGLVGLAGAGGLVMVRRRRTTA